MAALIASTVESLALALAAILYLALLLVIVPPHARYNCMAWIAIYLLVAILARLHQ